MYGGRYGGKKGGGGEERDRGMLRTGEGRDREGGRKGMLRWGKVGRRRGD